LVVIVTGKESVVSVVSGAEPVVAVVAAPPAAVVAAADVLDEPLSLPHAASATIATAAAITNLPDFTTTLLSTVATRDE
jgi:drug/metabolite transporter (DMT)-like permease